MTTLETAESAPTEPAVVTTGPDPDVTTHRGTVTVQPPKWLSSTDHKIIGQLYLIGGLLGLLATIAVNVLIGIERIDGNSVELDDVLAQLFDAQRVGLVFGAGIPLALALCVAIVPLQLGARSIAFPRLAALGFWLWLGGLLLNIVSLIANGGTLGDSDDMVDLFIASLAVMALGATATAGSIATSVLTTRAPGVTMRRVPFFSWSALITSLAIVLVMPVFVGTLIFLFLDHRNGRAGFGGNSGIYAWAGWLFTQPATYILAIPAIGIFAELLPVTFRKRTPARGVMIAGLGLISVAALAAVTQQNIQRLPWSGSNLDLDDLGTKAKDLVPFTYFNLLPLLGMLIVILMGLFLAKPERGVRPNLNPGFAFALFGYGMVFVGMLGTLLYSVDDLSLQGTVFEEAVLIYVVYGAVLGVLGGAAYWAPKLWGNAPSAAKVAPLALLGLLATVLASFPHYIAGFLDQPAGPIYDNDDLVIWNILVLVGHALMGLTVVAFIGLLLAASRSNDDEHDTIGDDPWDGQTLEWATTSPAPADNFVDVPVVHSAEPMLDLKAAAAGVGASTDGSSS
jgi:heme/copper-type cytochrome/quinol oxidase subunit 1